MKRRKVNHDAGSSGRSESHLASYRHGERFYPLLSVSNVLREQPLIRLEPRPYTYWTRTSRSVMVTSPGSTAPRLPVKRQGITSQQTPLPAKFS